MLTTEALQSFAQNGFALVPGLFSRSEVDRCIEHFMTWRDSGRDVGENLEYLLLDRDPLRDWPRIMHPHRRDAFSKSWLLDPRIAECLRHFLGEEPLAAQTMFYFKPPGARGQALHQDQFYLRARPGTCAAAWMACDPCDRENGCLRVVPGTAELPILCTQATLDSTKSFSDVEVPLPDHLEPVDVEMEPGDVLFFNGSVIHGSHPNTSTDRFRRSFIGHYVTACSAEVSQFYSPLLRMDGTEVTIEPAKGGGPCGVWNDGGDLELVSVQARGDEPEHE